jgi:hypothetical protein
LGYFQLLNLVDTFVLYDDVNFIKKGWINRNRVFGPKEPILFTIPLEDASQNKLIKDIRIHNNYLHWKPRFLNTLNHSYAKAPNFNLIYGMVAKILNHCQPGDSIRDLCLFSLQEVKQYLEIKTKIQLSSVCYTNQHLKAQDRILDICKQEGATTYINLIGGQELYSREDFQKENISLIFHKMKDIRYCQFDGHYLPAGFTPYLSIIDTLMFCHPIEIKKLLNEYELIQ